MPAGRWDVTLYADDGYEVAVSTWEDEFKHRPTDFSELMVAWKLYDQRGGNVVMDVTPQVQGNTITLKISQADLRTIRGRRGYHELTVDDDIGDPIPWLSGAWRVS